MSTLTHTPIPTSYRGYRFRSRLEARWAVFFDRMGIEYLYEPEGTVINSRRLNWGTGVDSYWYLPDFYLPSFGLWAEVKGQFDDQELLKFLNAAAYLSSPGGGCREGHDMIVLGNIPDPYETGGPRLPGRLHMHKGDLIETPWRGEPNAMCPQSINRQWNELCDDSGRPNWSRYPFKSVNSLLRGWPMQSWIVGGRPKYAKALLEARRARFEHGETPA